MPHHTILTAASLLLASALTASAAIVVPGANGTDGALNITANTEIDLGLAPTGQWDNDNTANAGKGVYDTSKWAVVFKYTSVNVAAGATVTFKNNASRAPVVWLVSGNVTIAGTVKLDGEDGLESVIPKIGEHLSEPGPGGFRGGSAFYSGGNQHGAGFGMGGGQKGGNQPGAYGTAGTSGSGVVYGNPSIVPLLGGSGGGGMVHNNTQYQRRAGGGGGAILIGATGNVTLSGTISAIGGDAKDTFDENSGTGSGGAVRIVCDTLVGSGILSCVGGTPQSAYYTSGNGRIRLERVVNTNSIATNPAPSVVDLIAGTTALLWPPTGAPEVKIISLGGVAAPADPKSGFGTIGADVAIPTATTTPCVVETTNVEQAS
jgi:plastocyanin